MATRNWKGTGSDFGTAADWVENAVPGPVDTANLGTGGGLVTGTGNVGTLNFNPGPAWTVQAQLAGGNINVNDSVDLVSGGRLTLTSGFVVIGSGNNASGNLTVEGGATLNSTVPSQNVNYILNVGGFSSQTNSTGTLTVQGVGASLNLNNNGAAVGIGAGDTGTLNVLAGATASFGTSDPTNNGTVGLSIARAGRASVLVDGAGSNLSITGGTYIARANTADGTLTVQNGGRLVETPAAAGAISNVIGSGANIGSTFSNGGTGRLNVFSGGTATFSDGLFFGQNGSTGIGRVTGGTLSVNNRIGLGFGTTAAGGNGSLDISGGGVVRSTAASDTTQTYFFVGGVVNTTGSALVTDPGSTLDIGQNAMSVGNQAGASVAILNGATLHASSANSAIQSAYSSGQQTTGDGTLTISGAGSSATLDGYVYFGRAGTGHLVLDAAGTLTGGQVPTGAGTGANAGYNVTIGDGTPNLDANGQPNNPLYYGGRGDAVVTNGSVLHSRWGLSIGNRGTTGTLLLDSASSAVADHQVVVGAGTDRTGGNGTVTVQGGSILRGGDHTNGLAGISIGSAPGTTGTVTVSGAGSRASGNGDRLTVGSTGRGTLNVTGGATADAGASYSDTEAALAVGGGVGGTGLVNVAGPGSKLTASGLAVLGGTNIGAGLTPGGTGTIGISGGGSVQTGEMVVLAGSFLGIDNKSSASIAGGLTLNGNVSSAGYLSVSGLLSGSGTLSIGGGVTDLAGIASTTVDVAAPQATLRLHSLGGNAAVNGLQFGDVIDLAGMTGATLSGNTVTAGGGALTLAAAPSGYAYKLYGDANGGTALLLNPTAPPPAAVSFTDATTNTSVSVSGDDYTGPVNYLQRQYITPDNTTHSLAIRANVPNAFLKGGTGDDALQALAGNNVLDGGPRSNFLIGGDGTDGGKDTFFVDARDPATVTWGTIVHFHQGDQATIFGFHPGVSTRPETALDGVGDFRGMTIHSEIAGPGTGVNASMTFAGIDQATADAHFVYSTGTLPGGNAPDIDYLLIQYT